MWSTVAALVAVSLFEAQEPWIDETYQDLLSKAKFCKPAIEIRVHDFLHESPNARYQAFIDRYPTTSYDLDAVARIFNGRPEGSAVPDLLARFDWFLPAIPPHLPSWHCIFGCTPATRRLGDPNTVYAYPSELSKVRAAIAAGRFDDRRADRVLVFGGSDTPLSQALGCGEKVLGGCETIVLQLKKYFKTILYMANDIQVEGVKTMPIGLSETWMRLGVAPLAEAAIAGASVAAEAKPRNVLAAWGARNPIEGASSADHPELRLNCRRAGWESKTTARAWAATPEAVSLGVETRLLHPLQFWGELSTYRFLVHPLGDGIQASRAVEALLVLTVPILRRGPYRTHDDLVDLGFPFVVVDTWEEITSNSTQVWWEALSPRLERFRTNCLSTDAYWRIFTGQLSLCV